MPITFEILDTPDVVVAHYSGDLILSEIVGVFAAYRADPGFRLDRPHLVDVAPDARTDAGFDQVFAMFSMFERAYAQSRVMMRVAISTPGETAFGVARIFETLAENSEWVQAAVFDNYDDALRWIGEQ